MHELTCQVIEITRGSTHDGPGLRTTIFLKGCPLRCLWCQNPEGMDYQQDVWWEKRKCIACLECLAACDAGALHATPEGIEHQRDLCHLCGACVETCPSQARSFTGQAWGLAALLHETLKDKDYFQAFGGGVTVSGGEPLSQPAFVAEFFQRLREAGVHTALDTCGLASQAAIDAVLPYTDYVLFDIKFMDAEQHRHFTGQPNELILHNLAYIASAIRARNQDQTAGRSKTMRLWIRTPLIPDTTATPENIGAISQFLRENILDVTERWELCAFNNACQAKYDKLGLVWAYENYPLLGQKAVSQLKEVALSNGINKEKLVFSGLIGRSD